MSQLTVVQGFTYKRGTRYEGAVGTVAWHEGDVIRKVRTLLGWTLEDLAAVSGVNFTVINRIELGKTKEPKRATLTKIARAFGWTPRQILEAVPTQGFALDLSIRKRHEPETSRDLARVTKKHRLVNEPPSEAALKRGRSAQRQT